MSAENFWPEPVYTYTEEQAVEDGILMGNPREDAFPECDLITTNLWNRIEKIKQARDLKRVFCYEPLELIGCLMRGAKHIYSEEKFNGDNDKDFFAMPANEEGLVVWFARNGNGKLTAMCPEDY